MGRGSGGVREAIGRGGEAAVASEENGDNKYIRLKT